MIDVTSQGRVAEIQFTSVLDNTMLGAHLSVNVINSNSSGTSGYVVISVLSYVLDFFD